MNTAMSSSQRLVFISMIIIIVVAIFASDGYVPSLPAITTSLQAHHSAVKLTVSFYLLGVGLAPLFFGPVSDRFGRKVIINIGLVVALLGSVICIVAPTINILILGRFIQGAGIAASMSCARAMLSDVFEGKLLSRASAMMGMTISVVPALAPIVGGYVQMHFGWRANFGVILVLILFSIVWCFFIMRETHHERDQHGAKPKQILKKYLKLIRNPRFYVYPLCTGITFSIVMCYLAVSPFILQNIVGLTPAEYGWTAIVTAVGVLLGAMLNGRLLHVASMEKLFLCSGIFMVIGSFFMLLFGLLGYVNVTVILAPYFIFVIGTQLVFGNAFSLSMAAMVGIAGAGTALYSSLQMGGSAIGSSLIAFFHSNNQIPLGIFMLVYSSLVLLLATYAYKRFSTSEQ